MCGSVPPPSGRCVELGELEAHLATTNTIPVKVYAQFLSFHLNIDLKSNVFTIPFLQMSFKSSALVGLAHESSPPPPLAQTQLA